MDQLQKICWHHWKDCHKISKIAKFESDTSYVSDNIAPQSCKNLQTFVWWGGGGGGAGVQVCALYHTKVCKILQLWGVIFSLAFTKSLSNLAILQIQRCTFQWSWQIFPDLSMPKVGKKKPWEGLLLHKVAAFHVDDVDQDQWFEVTRITAHQRNQQIHPGKWFISSFVVPWCEWSDHWFWSSKRNPLIVKFDIWTLNPFLKSAHLNI